MTVGALTPTGLQYVEDHLNPYGDEEELPQGVSNITGGRTFVSTDSRWLPSKPREGYTVFQDEVSADVLPASDRLVGLDHNSAPYEEVRQGLVELYDELRSANDLDCDPDERERLLSSLNAAQRLWDATQLKVIQIQVGIIITVQDTVDLLSRAGKAVGKPLLVDVIKSIVKQKTGIDL